MEENKFLDVQNLAEYIHLSKSCIYKMVSNKSIPHFKLGTRTLFERNQIGFTPGFGQKWGLLIFEIQQKFLLKKQAPILPKEVLEASIRDNLWFDHQLQMFRLHWHVSCDVPFGRHLSMHERHQE